MSRSVRCRGCGTSADGAFCPHCGRDQAGDPRERRDRRAWAVAWALCAAAVTLVALSTGRTGPRAVVPNMSNVGGAGGGPVATPDPVSLTARGRYDALFERLMRAGAEGDSATVANLAPQAGAAYAALDSVDADARFHAGLIAIQTGDFSGARALADTLEGRDPGHLFGPVLRAVLARLDGDAGGYRAALLQFRQRAGRELARTDRPEYLEHRQLLTEVQHAAESQ